MTLGDPSSLGAQGGWGVPLCGGHTLKWVVPLPHPRKVSALGRGRWREETKMLSGGSPGALRGSQTQEGSYFTRTRTDKASFFQTLLSAAGSVGTGDATLLLMTR